MPVHDDLGMRMKSYENKSKTYLNKKEPVILRIDGKAFHTFTKGFKRPFDDILIKSMQDTAKYLCENIQGCVLSYQQSDEITLVLVDYKNPNSSAWFDYKVQKCTSIAASMATMAFNKAFNKWATMEIGCLEHKNINGTNMSTEDFLDKVHQKRDLIKTYRNAIEKGAMFDARVFNLSKDEVTNCLYWRQLDAIRNSIQMVGQANFSHKELQNKSCEDIKNMLIEQKNIDWSSLPLYQQRGSCCIKKTYEHQGWESLHDEKMGKVGEILCVTERTRWIIDKEIPLFKETGREYVEKLINFE